MEKITVATKDGINVNVLTINDFYEVESKKFLEIKNLSESEVHISIRGNQMYQVSNNEIISIIEKNTDVNDYLNIVSLNLRSVFLASQTAAKYMASNGGGSIINISSIGGLVPDISQVAYGTSKAAINYLTKLIAVQGAASNIRCNAILPGMTATEAVEKNLSEEFRSFFLRHIPLNKVGLPEEIAAAAVYFASEESAYTTGQILAISGGFGLATPIYGDFVNKAKRRQVMPYTIKNKRTQSQN